MNMLLLDRASGALIRVLWLDGPLDVIIFNCAQRLAWPECVERGWLTGEINAGIFELQSADPFTPPTRKLTEAEERIQSKRWSVVQPIVADPLRKIFLSSCSCHIIAAAARDTGSSVTWIRSWLRLYWRCGQLKEGLVPSFARCGAPGKEREPGIKKRGRPPASQSDDDGGMNVDAVTREKLQIGWQKFRQEKSLPPFMAYTETLNSYFGVRFENEHLVLPDGVIAVPRFGQFLYHGGKIADPVAQLIEVKGEAGFARENRASLSTIYAIANYAGHIYYIDCTVTNVYLRSALYPKYLAGRAVLYFVVDAWSGLIVGILVTLEHPSRRGVRRALLNAFTSKVNWCAAFGITIADKDWPSGIPGELGGDRGSDVIADAIAEIGAELNFILSNLPSYRPDMKPVVERKFGSVDQDTYRWLPGRVQRRAPGDRDHRLDAMYTVYRLTQITIRYAIRYNHRHRVRQLPPNYIPENDLNPTHIDLWRWSQAHLGGPQHRDEEYVRDRLSQRVNLRETQYGLLLQEKGAKLYYEPEDKTSGASRLFVRVPGRRWKTHEGSLDWTNVSRIKVFSGRWSTGVPFVLTKRSERYANKSWDEVLQEAARQRAGQHALERERVRDRLEAQNERAMTTAEAQADLVRLTGGDTRVDLRGRHQAHTAEVENEKRTDRPVDPSATPVATSEDGTSSTATASERYQPRLTDLERLRRVRDAALNDEGRTATDDYAPKDETK
jgi:putative transposase